LGAAIPGALTVLVARRALHAAWFDIFFILALPFLGILASVGVCAIGYRVWTVGKPGWLVVLVTALFCMDTVRWVHRERLGGFSNPWSHWEALGRQVDGLTPPTGLIYAHDVILLTAKRLPPSGLENDYATRLDLTDALADSIHASSHPQWIKRLQQGRFDTALVTRSEVTAGELDLVSRAYRNSREVGGGILFWNRRFP